MLAAKSYIKPIGRGDTLPHLMMGNDGKCYVVKLMSNPVHITVLANELIAYRLGSIFNLPIPRSENFYIPNDLIFKTGQLRDAGASEGPHIGSAYLENVSTLDTYQEAYTFSNAESVSAMIVFDHWIENEDRCDNDENILVSSGSIPELVYIDHADAFTGFYSSQDSIIPVKSLWGSVYSRFAPLIDCPSPFEQPLAILESLNKEKIKNIIGGLPPEWRIDHQLMASLINQLEARIKLVRPAIEALRVHFPKWSSGGKHS